MSRGRLRVTAYGLRHLRQAPDLAALQAAESPEELARLALIPAGRNLGIAVGLLPAEKRAEAEVFDSISPSAGEPAGAQTAGSAAWPSIVPCAMAIRNRGAHTFWDRSNL